MSTVVDKSAGRDELEGMSSNSSSSSLRTAETLLRLLPIAPCVAALLVMLHDSQANEFGSVSYSHIGAFRYHIISLIIQFNFSYVYTYNIVN